MAEFASRITGSSDLYEHSDRRPTASINFVAAHDGFTLRDLVSYNYKHNEANGEGGQRTARATTDHGTAASRAKPTILRSTPCGCDSSANFITTLMLSQGVPMMAHGDELGRTQHGNNNVYAQDNELSLASTGTSTRTRRICWLLPRPRLLCARLIQSLRRRRFSQVTPKHGGRSELWRHYGGSSRTRRRWTRPIGTQDSPVV